MIRKENKQKKHAKRQMHVPLAEELNLVGELHDSKGRLDRVVVAAIVAR
jgi:hypothetical protein